MFNFFSQYQGSSDLISCLLWRITVLGLLFANKRGNCQTANDAQTDYCGKVLTALQPNCVGAQTSFHISQIKTSKDILIFFINQG